MKWEKSIPWKKDNPWEKSIPWKKGIPRKNYLAVVLPIIMVLSAGCGNAIPDMTEEQATEIGQYAAGLLLKYEKNRINRLVDLEALEEEVKSQAAEDTLHASTTEDGAGMSPVDDTPVIPTTETQENEPEIAEPMEQFLELPEGIIVQYQGVFAADYYPDAQGAVTAIEGSSLLVLNFQIINQSQTNQYVDILQKFPVFRVTVNGNVTKNVLYTMLQDDLSTYMGEIAAGETVNAVLLIEVEESIAGNVESVSLTMKNETKSSTIQLQ